MTSTLRRTGIIGLMVLSFIALAVAMVAVLAPTRAEAMPKYVSSLTSTDAGSTNTLNLKAGRKSGLLRCDIPFCVKTGTSTSMSANCDQDWVPAFPYNATLITYTTLDGGTGMNTSTASTPALPTIPSTPNVPFSMGNDSTIVARALDGGNPNCRVLIDDVQ